MAIEVLDGLREMELDLHEDIRKGNNIHFPSVLKFKRTVSGT